MTGRVSTTVHRLLATLILLAAFPASASAGTISPDDFGREYRAKPGEINHVTVRVSADSVYIADTAGVEPAAGCVSEGTGWRCSFAEPREDRAVRIYLGDGDDKALVDSAGEVPVNVAGGEGNDRLTGGSGAQDLFGGHGKDTMSGGPGDDRIFANEDPDRAERDRIRCGSGDDLAALESTDADTFGTVSVPDVVTSDCEAVRLGLSGGTVKLLDPPIAAGRLRMYIPCSTGIGLLSCRSRTVARTPDGRLVGSDRRRIPAEHEALVGLTPRGAFGRSVYRRADPYTLRIGIDLGRSQRSGFALRVLP